MNNKIINKNTKANSDKLYINKLISQGEHQQLDFKFEINDSRKIARTLVAFANTDGGRLLIGIKDNGAISGVKSDEEFYMVQAAAEMYCKPTINFEVYKWIIEGKTILEITINKGENVYYANSENNLWLVFIRVGDQNIQANKIVREVLKRKRMQIASFISYSKTENALLDYLSKNEYISISGFCRLAKISKYDAEKSLINLISMNIVKMHYSEIDFKYSLVKH
jgi:predicted HTH transcriptional regulator